jgi:homoserine dehydrogenase
LLRCCLCAWHVFATFLQAEQLREEFNIDIRVLGIADSKHMLTSEGGIDLSSWREQWESNKQPSDLQVGR